MMLQFRVPIFGLLIASGWVNAADPVHPCASVVEPPARLACYDKAFPPPPEVHQAAAKNAVEAFGKVDVPPRRPASAANATAADPQSIDGRVVRVDYGTGRRSVQLDNGQTWTLTESASAGPLKEGDEVFVRKGLMGSYLLRTPSGVSLRVRRTR